MLPQTIPLSQAKNLDRSVRRDESCLLLPIRGRMNEAITDFVVGLPLQAEQRSRLRRAFLLPSHNMSFLTMLLLFDSSQIWKSLC
jgi:hypothetical protein